MKFFQDKGWSKAQAAGIVGNLYMESGLKTAVEGDNKVAYGIAQWHPPRQARFKHVYNKDIRQSTFKEQLEFVNWELNNDEKRAGNSLRKAKDPAHAAYIVDTEYERSKRYHTKKRMDYAKKLFDKEVSALPTPPAEHIKSAPSYGSPMGGPMAGPETAMSTPGSIGGLWDTFLEQAGFSKPTKPSSSVPTGRAALMLAQDTIPPKPAPVPSKPAPVAASSIPTTITAASSKTAAGSYISEQSSVLEQNKMAAAVQPIVNNNVIPMAPPVQCRFQSQKPMNLPEASINNSDDTIKTMFTRDRWA